MPNLHEALVRRRRYYRLSNSAAIWRLVRPWATRDATSRSRRLSAAGAHWEWIVQTQMVKVWFPPLPKGRTRRPAPGS
jgi:hypothetical protein